jgi:hypothetical protein
MVRPKHFGYNAQTAGTNRFQLQGAEGRANAVDVAQQALREFDAFAAALTAEGVKVCVVPDTDSPRKPDAVFPNNWVSFHADGTVVLYPMHAENRRGERRPEIIDTVVRETGFQVRRVLDLTGHEKQGRFLEGTGSLVLDHRARIAYACRSPRTDESVAREWAREMGFELELFDATDESGTPIYHTNVLMYVGTRVSVVNVDAIAPADRARVSGRLVASGLDVIAIDHAEMRAFAGNMLELEGGSRRLLVMSAAAAASLDIAQLQRLQEAGIQPLISAIPTIEAVGGGSVRCMLAEVPAASTS